MCAWSSMIQKIASIVCYTLMLQSVPEMEVYICHWLASFLRTSPWWSLCTLYLLTRWELAQAIQVSIAAWLATHRYLSSAINSLRWYCSWSMMVVHTLTMMVVHIWSMMVVHTLSLMVVHTLSMRVARTIFSKTFDEPRAFSTWTHTRNNQTVLHSGKSFSDWPDDLNGWPILTQTVMWFIWFTLKGQAP